MQSFQARNGHFFLTALFIAYGGVAACSESSGSDRMGDEASMGGSVTKDPSLSGGASSGGASSGGALSGGASSGGASSGGASSGGASSGGAPADAGRVDFVPFYEPGSAWETDEAARAAAETLLLDFESTLRTGGQFDAKVDACFLDNHEPKFTAATGISDWETIQREEGDVEVPPTWRMLVLGDDSSNSDPMADPSAKACEFFVEYNFDALKPQDNLRQLRERLLSGLGFGWGLLQPVMTKEDVLEFFEVGEVFPLVPRLHDLALVDATGTQLIEYDASAGKYLVKGRRFHQTFEEWAGTDLTGLSFVGIADDGKEFPMMATANPCADDADKACANSALIPRISFPCGSDVPCHQQLTLDESDRAWLRGVGYTVVVPQK